MAATAKHPVAIFWDFGMFRKSDIYVQHSPNATENCPLANLSSTCDTVQRISKIAHQYGDVMSLKAYADLKIVMSDRRRTELYSAGISLIDCPHNGQKEVVDKTIIGRHILYV
jgi:hypothetical protein